MNPLPTQILAVDHRVQLTDEAARQGVDVTRCREFKRLVVEAFLAARARSAAVRQHGGLLLDSELGLEALQMAREHGIPVGQPAERSGVFPLQLSPTLADEVRAGRPAFLKCLVRGRPDDPPGELDAQHETLGRLSALSSALEVPLVLELIVPRQAEPEDAFESRDRPRLTASWMAALHARGIRPAHWKLEGMASAEGAREVAGALLPGEEIVVLGKSAPLEQLSRWFRAARAVPAHVGFAVGRTIFWEPFVRFLAGGSSDEAIAAIRDGYLNVVTRWEEAGP